MRRTSLLSSEPGSTSAETADGGTAAFAAAAAPHRPAIVESPRKKALREATPGSLSAVGRPCTSVVSASLIVESSRARAPAVIAPNTTRRPILQRRPGTYPVPHTAPD